MLISNLWRRCTQHIASRMGGRYAPGVREEERGRAAIEAAEHDPVIRRLSTITGGASPSVATPHEEPLSGSEAAALCRGDGTLVDVLACNVSMGALTIGRHEDAFIQVNDPFVSRQHAVLQWDDQQRMHMISDLGSGNGTRVNGIRISGPVHLVDGARVRVGRTNLVYRRASR